MYTLNNKTAIVTGGSKGIGRATSKLLSASGASVYFIDIDDNEGLNLQQEIADEGYKSKYVHCNVSSHEEVKKTIDQIHLESGKIDILVNNAGIAHIGNATNTSPEDFQKIYDVNIKGVYNFLNSCIPYMQKDGGGVIVNMTSVAADLGIPDRFAYSMSKGAVSAMTLSVAKDYLGDNIRCNGIAPGRVHTPFVDNFIKKNYPGKELEMFEKLSKTQPIGRMGKPEEIAALIQFLCSDQASFITGSIYPIDGGFIKLNS
ncbi:MAG: SDR family NAD(P)-dependent oxidoreductase [Bacteroidota bacterium]